MAYKLGLYLYTINLLTNTLRGDLLKNFNKISTGGGGGIIGILGGLGGGLT